MMRSKCFSFGVLMGVIAWVAADEIAAAPIIIDHARTDLTALSLPAVEKAKAELHVAYEHTSHGSQVTDGMTALNPFINGG
ncbi:MAG: hypothetical protein JW719_12175, partial [Pirellulales bacterium]|nr:hypothetical protein [Pirellulales bacterium]